MEPLSTINDWDLLDRLDIFLKHTKQFARHSKTAILLLVMSRPEKGVRMQFVKSYHCMLYVLVAL